MQGKGNAQREGWQAAEAGLREAGGGGAMLLHATTEHLKQHAKFVDRLKSQGGRVINVNDWKDVLEFARQFSL